MHIPHDFSYTLFMTQNALDFLLADFEDIEPASDDGFLPEIETGVPMSSPAKNLRKETRKSNAEKVKAAAVTAKVENVAFETVEKAAREKVGAAPELILASNEGTLCQFLQGCPLW